MVDLALSALVDRLVALDLARFQPNPREVRRKLVVLGLSPALERMVVALITREPDAQEELRHILGRLIRVARHAEVAGGRVVVGAALSGQDIADEFIVWAV